jgi:hypothetical protein
MFGLTAVLPRVSRFKLFNVFAGILPSSAVAVKRGSGRSRGRPRGSGVSLRSRGPGSIQRSLVAAEEAAATAAKTAAYAAYGYSFTGTENFRITDDIYDGSLQKK